MSVLLALCGVFAVAAPALAGGAPNQPAPTASANQAAAQAEAQALLSALSLPPGAIASTTEPAGDGGVLAHPGSGPPATPDVIDLSGWWVLPNTAPASAIAYLTAHPPSGSTLDLRGDGSGPGTPSVTFVGLGRPPRAGVLSQRELVVEAVPLRDGSTGLRADAQVVWLIPRPPGERIPGGITAVKASTYRGAKLGRRTTFRSQRQIRAIVAAINGLELFQPGARSCPIDLGANVQLVFERGRTQIAIAHIDVGGCEPVTLRLRGVAEPELQGGSFGGTPIAALLQSARRLASR
jgi:hypothetical protein